MASSVMTDFPLVRGDTWLRRFTISDVAGVAVDVSGWTFLGVVRSDPDATAELASMAFGMTAAAGGVVDAAVSGTDSATFPAPFVYYHVRATLPDATVLTLSIGRLLITKDSARAP